MMTGATALLLMVAPLRAQGLQISPIQVQLAPGQMSTTLSVTNQADQPAVMQIRPFQWTQGVDGSDVLTATADLAVSPPSTQIAAGRTQIFRIVLKRPAMKAEASFRVLLDQLPPPASAGTVRVALRFSVPVFSEPDTRMATDLDWRVTLDPTGAFLVAINRGGQHLKVLNTTLTPSSGPVLTVSSIHSPYILPGVERKWPIVGAHLRPGDALRLAAVSDVGPVDATVHVTGP